MKYLATLILACVFFTQVWAQVKTIETQTQSITPVIDSISGDTIGFDTTKNYRLVITDSLSEGVINTLTSPWQDSSSFVNTFYRRGFTDPSTGIEMAGVKKLMHQSGVFGGRNINYEREGRRLYVLFAQSGFPNYVQYQQGQLDIWEGQWIYAAPGQTNILVNINANELVRRDSDNTSIARIRPWDDNYIEFLFLIQADKDTYGNKVIMFLTQDGPGYYEGKDKDDNIHRLRFKQ